jgi:hypothetical protein
MIMHVLEGTIINIIIPILKLAFELVNQLNRTLLHAIDIYMFSLLKQITQRKSKSPLFQFIQKNQFQFP